MVGRIQRPRPTIAYQSPPQTLRQVSWFSPKNIGLKFLKLVKVIKWYEAYLPSKDYGTCCPAFLYICYIRPNL